MLRRILIALDLSGKSAAHRHYAKVIRPALRSRQRGFIVSIA
jgi:hypothetical protein